MLAPPTTSLSSSFRLCGLRSMRLMRILDGFGQLRPRRHDNSTLACWRKRPKLLWLRRMLSSFLSKGEKRAARLHAAGGDFTKEACRKSSRPRPTKNTPRILPQASLRCCRRLLASGRKIGAVAKLDQTRMGRTADLGNATSGGCVRTGGKMLRRYFVPHWHVRKHPWPA